MAPYWLGFALADVGDGKRSLFLFPEIRTGVQMGVRNRDECIRKVGALAQCADQGYGGIDEWLVEEALRGGLIHCNGHSNRKNAMPEIDTCNKFLVGVSSRLLTTFFHGGSMFFNSLKVFLFGKEKTKKTLGIGLHYAPITQEFLDQCHAVGCPKIREIAVPGASVMMLTWRGKEDFYICPPRNRGIPRPSEN